MLIWGGGLVSNLITLEIFFKKIKKNLLILSNYLFYQSNSTGVHKIHRSSNKKEYYQFNAGTKLQYAIFSCRLTLTLK